jgi:hypothetical protein
MSPLEAFLAPLARLATRFPDAEGAVLWADGGTWQAQDDTTERLDAEEIAFYAEGLLAEGFNMIWQAFAATETPKEIEHVLLMFWQSGIPPALPAPPDGWLVLGQGTWQGGAA